MMLKKRASLEFTKSAMLFALLSTANNVLAEETAEQAAEKSANEATQDQGPWRVTLGVGVMSMPEYPGSGSEETRALPLVSLRYKRFFLGGAPGAALPGGLGMFLYEDKKRSLAAVAAPGVMDPRKESDDASLRGLGDIEGTTRVGISGRYRAGWLSLSANVLSDVGGNTQGTTANLDARAAYRPLPRLMLSAGPGITWGNEEYMQTFFGIDHGQAERSAFAPYQAGSGISLVRFSVGAQYQLTNRWGLGANLTAARLQGDAADSPVVEDRNQNSYALFLAYRF